MTGFAGSFPVIKVFPSNGVRPLKSIRERTADGGATGPVYRRMRPVCYRVDQLSDKNLASIDKRYPQIRTAEPRKVVALVHEPARRARRTMSPYRRAAGEQLSERVVRPLKTVS